MDISRADVGAAKDAIARNRDFIVGVKARPCREMSPPTMSRCLSRAQDVATSFDLPVMIHMGQTVSPLPRLLNLLKRGDIVTHMFAPPPNSIIDDNWPHPAGGACRPAPRRVVRRRQWTDRPSEVGHRRPRACRRVFGPIRFPLTGTRTSRTTAGVIDFPNVMSKFLSVRHDARSGGRARDRQCLAPSSRMFNDRGTLNVGAPADVAVLELREGMFRIRR